MNKFDILLRSRKFWAAVVGIAFCFLNQYWPDLPLNEENALNIVIIAVGYIVGTAIEDTRKII